MIEVRHLSKNYGNHEVVGDVSFKVETGEVMVLLGTSGSGKTTTLKMINKLVGKSSGTVLIQNKNIDDFRSHELRRKIGYVIQSIGLFPHYTIKENIATVPGLLGWPKPKITERVVMLLGMMNLPLDLQNRKSYELSGGQQQRVGIARALAADPDVILLDEPFGALDPITRAELQQEFKGLKAGLNKSMIMVTHDVMEAVMLADKICLMDKGAVQQLGTPKELIFNPKNDFVKQFMGQQKIQLEMNVITLADLKKVSGIDLSDNQKLSLSEYLGKTDDQSVIQLYFKHREQIITWMNEPN